MESDSIRKDFNSNFTDEKYQDFLKYLNSQLPSPIAYRISESPLFLNNECRDTLINAGNQILDFLLQPNFKELTEEAIPNKWRCPNENDHPHFIGIDFALSKDKDGKFAPKLVELQGFSGVYALQAYLSDAYRAVHDIPDNLSIYFKGVDKDRYFNLLKEMIIGPYQPDEVVLMDIHPHKQHTACDFYFLQKHVNIPIVGLADLRQEGKKLFYEHQGQKKFIKRIYNRLIFDEIDNDPDIFKHNVDVRQDLDVEWITHPNWYYRISKFLLPYLKGDCVPKAYFLNKIINNIPGELENYILKPLYSFGGHGVIIDITKDEIEKIKDPENWILQEKIIYEPILKFQDTNVIAEVRLMYFWPDGHEKPILTANNTRLSAGKMINVQSNKNSKWAGATVIFMEK